MKQAVRTEERCDHRIRIQDADELFTVLGFSLIGLLGCLVSQAPLDGPAFAVARSLPILASLITALTGLVVGGGE